MTHHPHVHMIVPGGGIALDGTRWISSRPAFLLPVRVLGAVPPPVPHPAAGSCTMPASLPSSALRHRLADRRRSCAILSPVRKKRWVVYAKPPFAGPQAVLAYLSRYTHRVAISNRRLHRLRRDRRHLPLQGLPPRCPERQQVMTLSADEFIRRFLLHVLPRGFHRIRHYGLLAGSARKDSLALARQAARSP
jgi:hypothetical protein